MFKWGVCRVKCVGVECVGWKLKPPFDIRCSDVIWEAVVVLTSSGINDCGEQPTRVSGAALMPAITM